jgi:hypothetical protein
MDQDYVMWVGTCCWGHTNILDITLTIRLFARLGTSVKKGRENLKIIVLS